MANSDKTYCEFEELMQNRRQLAELFDGGGHLLQNLRYILQTMVHFGNLFVGLLELRRVGLELRSN